VLDDELAAARVLRGGRASRDEHGAKDARAIDEEIDESAAFDRSPHDDRRQDESGRQLFRDFPRGALQDFRELEGDRAGEIAELHFRGRLEDDARRRDPEDAEARLRNGALELTLEAGNHAASLPSWARVSLSSMAARILARRNIPS